MNKQIKVFSKNLNNKGFICFWSQYSMVQPQEIGDPEKADLSRPVKFMSDDSI